MISAGEVGAVFTIKDDASAVLARLADQFNALQGVIDKIKESIASIGGMEGGLGKLQEQLTQTGRAGADASQIITDAFGKVDGAVDTAISRVNALRDSFTQAAEAARAVTVAPGMGGGSRGGAGGGGEDPHLNVQPHKLGGGFSVSGLAPWWAEIPMAAVGYGLDEDLKVRQNISEGLLLAHVPDADQKSAGESLYNRVVNSSKALGFSPEVMSEAYKKSETSLGTLSFDRRTELEESLMPYAAGESKLKGTPLPESLRAMIGMVHMFQDYDPEDMKKIVPGFQVSSLFTPATLPQFERAASYPAVLHTEMGMDPQTILTQVAALQSAGVMNTKSGTWIKNFWQHMMPSQGSSKSDIEHNDALRDLGLIDDKNNRTWGGDDPMHPDYNKGQFEIAQTMQAKMANMTPEQKTDLFHRAFGEQGKGWGALEAAPKFVEQLTKMSEMKESWERTEQGGNIIGNLAKVSPLQQIEMAKAGFQANMMTASHDLTPDAASALKDLANAAGQAAGAIHTAFGWMQAGADLANKTQDIAKAGHTWLADKLGMHDDQSRLGSVGPDGTVLPVGPGDKALPFKSASPIQFGGFHPENILMQHAGASVGAPPVTVSSPVTAPLTGTASVSVTINNTSLAAEIKQVVQAEIKGAFSGLMSMFKSGSGNSSAGFDGRSAPSTPDASVMHGGH